MATSITRDVRLLAYAAAAAAWIRATGGTTVTSNLLEAETGFHNTVVRRDLAAAGIRGSRGHGYDATLLHAQVLAELGMLPGRSRGGAVGGRREAAISNAYDVRACMDKIIREHATV